MADTNFMQNWQIVQDGDLSVLGKTDRTDNETLLKAIDAQLDCPLRLFASLPADTLLNIASSLVNKGNGTGDSLPPINNALNIFVATTIDFQSGGVSGGTVTLDSNTFTLPDSSAGMYRRMILGFVDDGSVNCRFSSEVSNPSSLPDPGTLLTGFNYDALIGYIDLEASGTNSPGKYRTIDSTSDIIENSTSGTPRIVKFPHNIKGGGGGSESLDDAYNFGATITTTSGIGPVVIAGAEALKITATGGLEVNILKFKPSAGQLTLSAPSGASANYVLPGTVSSGQFLKTDGSGILSWATTGIIVLSTGGSSGFSEVASELAFDETSGFVLTSPSAGRVEVALSGHFQTIHGPAGQPDIVASGQDAFTVDQGDGIQVTTNSSTKTITISIDSTIAGDGLTLSSGVLAVGAGDGLTVASDSISISSSVAGDGLSYSSGVLNVGAGDGLTVASDSIAVQAADNTISVGSDGIKIGTPTDGSANQFLQTDGSGNVSWETINLGSGTLQTAYDNTPDVSGFATITEASGKAVRIIGSDNNIALQVEQSFNYSTAFFDNSGIGSETVSVAVSNPSNDQAGIVVNNGGIGSGIFIIANNATNDNAGLTYNGSGNAVAIQDYTTGYTIGLRASSSTTEDYNLTLPVSLPTAGQALKSTESGILSWGSFVSNEPDSDETIYGIKTFDEFPVTPSTDPSTNYQVANKKYVNDQDALKVSKTGDTMSGNLTMTSGAELLGLPLTPSLSHAAASKAYVDAVAQGLAVKGPVLVTTASESDLTGVVSISGVSTTATPSLNPLITTISSTTIRVSIPSQPFFTGDLIDLDSMEATGGIPANDINGKRIITAASSSWIEVSADSAATTSASGGGLLGVVHGILILTSPSGLTFDGLEFETDVVSEDRVLIRHMPSGYEQHNGLFNYYGKVSNDYHFERAVDADNSPNNEIYGGAFVFVDKGATCADTSFVLTEPDGLVNLGVDDEVWSQFSSAGSIAAGDGLQKVGSVISVKLDGDTLAASGSGLKVVEVYLGPAPDGDYGSPGGNAPGVEAGDSVESSTDKIIEVIDKLVPPKPPNLSTKTLSISGTYTALESGTSTSKSNVIDNYLPLATTPSGTANGFFDGDAGTLSCKIDTVASGSKVLTTSDDSGTYTALKINTDYDFYAGQAGKENFWHALTAGVQTTSSLALGAHTYQLIHTTTGSTAVYGFYVDNPITPTISSYSTTGSGTGRWISGVPSLASGDTITALFTVGSAIRQCYNATRIGSANSSYTNSANASLPGSPPSDGDPFNASIGLTVSSSVYSENASVNCVGYNSKGGTATQAVTGSIRLDTVSNESSRKLSGTGQFPTKGSGATQFGDPFVSTATLVGTDELQLLNGLYQDPSHTNYSSNLPTAGPDYSGIGAGSWNSTRWVTLNIGSISSASSITVTINNTTGFGSSALVSGISLYVLIDGATGWLDGNAAYPGVGDPVNNGDAALVVGSSTATSKRITFGTTTRSGNVWVRLGLPDSSTKKLSGFTLS